MDESGSWSQEEGGVQKLQLLASSCRQQIDSASSRWTSPWAAPAARGRCSHDAWKLAAAPRRLPHLPTFQRWVHAVSTLVTLLLLHGVAVAR